MQQEATIREYFQAWLTKDARVLAQVFARDAVYVECYGPEYRGLSQITRWFTDWNQRGTVLEWRIGRIVEQPGTLVAQWYFSCEFDGNVDGFDGVTVADFDQDGKIIRLCEFQSKTEHYLPYAD